MKTTEPVERLREENRHLRNLLTLHGPDLRPEPKRYVVEDGTIKEAPHDDRQRV